jgi:5-hydroxyisourate hydrolase-like protein (transthyretin family)
MRLSVAPTRVELDPSRSFTVAITVTNTGTVIGGYHLRILGADPSWVRLDAENLSLFPETTQTVLATIEIPRGVNAGDRRIAVQVREITPPQAVAVAEIELTVPGHESVKMSLSPMSVTCGKRGRFSVVAENTGNMPVSVAPIGTDPEAKIGFTFVPDVLDLAPGEHVITDLRTSARRRWFGGPVVRPFALSAVSPSQRDEIQARAAAAKEAKRRAKRLGRKNVVAEPATAEAPPEPPKPLAQGSIIQKPKLGRGVLSLLSLLLAVTVFAVVITIALSRLVGVSAADRDLAIQVAQARDSSVGAGSSAVGGTVTFLTGGAPAPDVTVEVFSAGDLTAPVISTATDSDGAWKVATLSAGSYKIRFRGAGFAELWYPNALTGADATAVKLEQAQQVTNLAVTLGGLPATISGKVSGTDVAGAVLTVQVPTEFLHSADTGGTNSADGASGDATADSDSTSDAGGATAGDAVPGAAADDGNAFAGDSGTSVSSGAALQTIPISSDGLFTLTDLPSPAVYDLVVAKPGFASDSQRVDLSGGESRSGVALVLRSGDGLISGTVTGPDGPLGNAVVTAVSGENTVRTLTLTKGTVGAFTLRGLATPATYTVTVTAPGYTTVTSTLTLTDAQKLTGVLLSLQTSAGTLSGMVTLAADGTPATGVAVTVAAGSDKPLTTVTQSGAAAGAWSIAGLPVPGTFTITFSRSDLQSQTVSVAMNAAGVVTSGAGPDGSITAAMMSAYATVSGTVRQQGGAGGEVAAGEATVTLASGEATYSVTSASVPAEHLGRYYIGHVAPGTYTMSVVRKGTSPTTVIVTVTAGQNLVYNPVLIAPASVSGSVTSAGKPLPGAEVTMYLSSQYPAKVYAQTTADASGHYSFTGVDAPQAYVIEVRDAAGPATAKTVVLEASQAATVNLVVPAPSAPAANAPDTTAPNTTPPNTTPPGTANDESSG